MAADEHALQGSASWPATDRCWKRGRVCVVTVLLTQGVGVGLACLLRLTELAALLVSLMYLGTGNTQQDTNEQSCRVWAHRCTSARTLPSSETVTAAMTPSAKGTQATACTSRPWCGCCSVTAAPENRSPRPGNSAFSGAAGQRVCTTMPGPSVTAAEKASGAAMCVAKGRRQPAEGAESSSVCCWLLHSTNVVACTSTRVRDVSGRMRDVSGEGASPASGGSGEQLGVLLAAPQHKRGRLQQKEWRA